MPARGGMCGRREEEELASGNNVDLCEAKCGLHIVDRAEGDGVESAVDRHLFDAAGPDLRGEIEGADSFAEKAGFFVLGFGEGDLNIRTQKPDRDAREACPGAEVEEGGGVAREMARGKEAFAKMTANNLFRVADCGEIGAGVPFEEEVEVQRELGQQGSRGIRKIRCEEVGDCGF